MSTYLFYTSFYMSTSTNGTFIYKHIPLFYPLEHDLELYMDLEEPTSRAFQYNPFSLQSEPSITR